MCDFVSCMLKLVFIFFMFILLSLMIILATFDYFEMNLKFLLYLLLLFNDNIFNRFLQLINSDLLRILFFNQFSCFRVNLEQLSVFELIKEFCIVLQSGEIFMSYQIILEWIQILINLVIYIFKLCNPLLANLISLVLFLRQNWFYLLYMKYNMIFFSNYIHLFPILRFDLYLITILIFYNSLYLLNKLLFWIVNKWLVILC